ncbi:MAG TPA: hypothetical protein HPP97_15825 [Desulfuromonadales bacterium]|nr:hypothetical protein [Desulfuromonadales bacterium]
MTIETLFGKEEVSAVVDGISKPRTIKFKQIEAIYETLIVREEITGYLQTGQRYRAPARISDTFQFLNKEPKEQFITLHLDGKNRVICRDVVSIGSLNHPYCRLLCEKAASAGTVVG